MGPTRWRQYDVIKFMTLKGPRGNDWPDGSRPLQLKSSIELLTLSLRTPSLLLIPLGAIPSVLYTFGGSETRRSAILTDILALTFSFNALSLLTIDSFKTGCILLSGLFLYDVWWVFGTEVVRILSFRALIREIEFFLFSSRWSRLQPIWMCQ